MPRRQSFPCDLIITAALVCGDTGDTTQVRRVCAHGHARDAHLCPPHLATWDESAKWCATCLMLDGHNCPVVMVPAEHLVMRIHAVSDVS